MYAAKTDSEEMLNEVLALPGTEFDVNYQDGLGNTGKPIRQTDDTHSQPSGG